MECRKISCLQSNVFINKIFYFCVTGLYSDKEASISSTTNWNKSQSNCKTLSSKENNATDICELSKDSTTETGMWTNIFRVEISAHVDLGNILCNNNNKQIYLLRRYANNQYWGKWYSYCFKTMDNFSRVDNLMITSYVLLYLNYSKIFKSWLFCFVEDNKIMSCIIKYICRSGLNKIFNALSVVRGSRQSDIYCLLLHYVWVIPRVVSLVRKFSVKHPNCLFTFI